MKLPVSSLTLTFIGALAGMQVACAHAPARVEDQAQAPGRLEGQTQAKNAPSQRVFVTGSHVAQRVDPSTGLPLTISPVRIYTRGQIDDTGRQSDLGAALRTLDPSITP
jgi:hypothetical protein